MVIHIAPKDEAMVSRARNADNTRVVPLTLETLRAMKCYQRVEAIRKSQRWVEQTLAAGHLGAEETLLTVLAHRHPDLIHHRTLSTIGRRLRATLGYRAAHISRYLPRST